MAKSLCLWYCQDIIYYTLKKINMHQPSESNILAPIFFRIEDETGWLLALILYDRIFILFVRLYYVKITSFRVAILQTGASDKIKNAPGPFSFNVRKAQFKTVHMTRHRIQL